MLTVTNLAGETEALTGIQGFKMVEDNEANFSIRFSTSPTPDNPGYALVEEESEIEIEEYLFRVKQLKETRTRKEVSAISIFYDLKGSRQDVIYGGTRTFNEFATFIFQNTGWTFSSVDVTGSKLIANFGEDNVVKLVEMLCAVYECEMQIMPGKHVIFKKEIGGDYDEQYRYKHNVKTLSKSVDTTNLRTRIKGYGAEGLIVTYTSPNHTKFGIIDADPVRDDQFATAESMTEHLKRTLIDYPEVSFEMETAELTERELGERIWLIYEPMNMEFKTRILSKTRGLRNGKLYTESVTLGNTVPRKLSDILISQRVDIDENAKEFRSRFEQTNDRITMEVEQVNESIASFNIRADEMTLSVSNLMGRVAGAESTLSIQAGQISSKVEQRDFNGNSIVSMINQTPSNVTIQASKIDLVGIVTISDLNTPGKVVISEGNIVGESFTVGRGTNNPSLSMYSTQGSHRIYSRDGAGFRIQSTGTLSLQADNGTIYANSKFWAQANLQVTGSSELQTTYITSLHAQYPYKRTNGVDYPLATEVWVANMNYLSYNQMTSYIAGLNLTTVAWVNSALATKESQIVAWANGKFVAK